MRWETIAEYFVVGYFTVSIVLEILALIFFFTPSPEDDRWVAKVQEYWMIVRKYFLLVSIRTPLTVLFSILHTTVLILAGLIKKRFKRDKIS